jgi:mRNA interferase HigB
MRVISKSALVKFWGQQGCSDSEVSLRSWHDEALKASWKTPQDINDQYRSASICDNNRVVVLTLLAKNIVWLSRCSTEQVLRG